MDKVLYTSFKIKVWEDKLFKLEKQRENMLLHLDDIQLSRRETAALPDHHIAGGFEGAALLGRQHTNTMKPMGLSTFGRNKAGD